MLDKKDKRQTRCLASFHMAMPQEEIFLRCVRVESLREWLSHPEGPELIDSHANPPIETFRALAIGLDPEFLYKDPKEVVVGLGMVLKPPYINTVSFEVAAAHFNTWVDQSSGKKLSEPCFMLLSISVESKVLPLCKGFPFLLDVSNKETSEDKIAGGCLGDFRGFRLPRVLAKEDVNSTECEVYLVLQMRVRSQVRLRLCSAAGKSL